MPMTKWQARDGEPAAPSTQAVNPLAENADDVGAPAPEIGPHTGNKTSATAGLIIAASCGLAAIPALATYLPDLFQAEPARKLAVVAVSSAITGSAVSALWWSNSFEVAPKLEMVGEQLRQMHSTAKSLLTSSREMSRRVGSIEGRLATLELEQGSRRVHRRAGQRPVSEIRDLSDAAFATDATGSVVTIEPYWAGEVGGGRLSSGDVHVYAQLPSGIAQCFARLKAGSPVERWRVVFPIDGTIASLIPIIKFKQGLEIYAARAAEQGAAFDLTKLEIRLIEQRPEGKTLVTMNQWELDTGDRYKEVLTYDAASVESGRPSLGATTRGPDYEAALLRESLSLSRSVCVSLSALDLYIGPCSPDKNGFVSRKAFQQWSASEKPSIGDLLTCTGQDWWPASVD